MRTLLRLPALAAVLITLGVSGCASDQSSSKPAPTAETAKAMEGRATWYGPGLYGNKTASGEVLKEGTMTAAHSSLPLGTEVKVTRLDTDESVTVVINDRKPYKEGTVIDLAHGAADALDIDDDATANVSIEVMD
jgi:rare lipoprotein A